MDNMDNKDNKIIDRICNTAFNLSVIGVCIVGICPAFAFMPIAVDIVLKKKNIKLEGINLSKIKKARFMSAVSLVMFVLDIIIAYFFFR